MGHGKMRPGGREGIAKNVNTTRRTLSLYCVIRIAVHRWTPAGGQFPHGCVPLGVVLMKRKQVWARPDWTTAPLRYRTPPTPEKLISVSLPLTVLYMNKVFSPPPPLVAKVR